MCEFETHGVFYVCHLKIGLPLIFCFFSPVLKAEIIQAVSEVLPSPWKANLPSVYSAEVGQLPRRAVTCSGAELHSA